MNDIINRAKRLAELKVPPLRAEVTVHEDEDPRYADDCLVQIIEKDDEYSIWYEEEHGGYEHGKLHFAHVFAAAPELAQALAEETWEHRHEYRAVDDQQWYALTPWAEGEPDCRPWNVTPTRIVRRRVSPPEVVNE